MFSVSQHVRSSFDDYGAVILDIQHGQVLRLNKTASFIFEHLTHTPKECEIVRHLVEEFRVPYAVAQADVREFLESMVRLQLVYRYPSKVHA